MNMDKQGIEVLSESNFGTWKIQCKMAVPKEIEWGIGALNVVLKFSLLFKLKYLKDNENQFSFL